MGGERERERVSERLCDTSGSVVGRLVGWIGMPFDFSVEAGNERNPAK